MATVLNKGSTCLRHMWEGPAFSICPYCNPEGAVQGMVRKSLDDCTGQEWNAASQAAGWGAGSAVQPAPVTTKHPASWDLVLADMKERDQFGKSKYGTSLQPGNGRDTLADAYQEALDLAVYLRTAIYERDGK